MTFYMIPKKFNLHHGSFYGGLTKRNSGNVVAMNDLNIGVHSVTASRLGWFAFGVFDIF